MSSEEKKPITIRGIDRRLYEEMVARARKLGKTVGELINEAMELFLAFREGVKEVHEAVLEGLEEARLAVISDVEELSLSAKDLGEVKGKLLIRNIGKLIFEDDVTQELFDEKVRRIIRVNEVIIPKSLSKIKVLSKCLYVKTLKSKE